MRSCHSGLWQLSHDLAGTVPGRYFFCDEDTPAYPGPHVFGSAYWLDKTDRKETVIGEIDGHQRWDEGAPPNPAPVAKACGDKGDIANGSKTTYNWYNEQTDFPIPGFPPCCFEVPVNQFQIIDALTYPNGMALADVCSQGYDDPNIGKIVFEAYFPTYRYVYGYVRQSPLEPTLLVMENDYQTVVVIAGTTHLTQLLMQAVYPFGGLRNVGVYSVSGFYADRVDFVLNKFMDAAITYKPNLLLCGHSLGGAMAQLIAVRCINASPRTFSYSQLQCLTWGAPCIGDARFIQLLRDCTNRHYRNENDPIPMFPPGPAQVNLYFQLVTIPLFSKWLFAKKYETFTLLTDAREKIPTSGDTLPSTVMEFFTNLIVTNQIFGVLAEHSIDTYRDRLKP